MGVGVAELGHDGGGVGAAGNEDRGVGVAELVGREAAWERWVAAFGEEAVGGGDGGLEDAIAEVVLVALAARACREYEVVRAGRKAAGAVSRQDGSEDWEQVDGAVAGVGLGAGDVEAGAWEVDVAPAELTQLVGAQAGEQERGDDGVAVAHAAARVGVQLGRGVQQRLDRFCGVQMHRAGLGGLQAPAAACGGVVGDVAVLPREGQHRLQHVDRLVHRSRGERAQDRAGAGRA